jgi:hypothetical protein
MNYKVNDVILYKYESSYRTLHFIGLVIETIGTTYVKVKDLYGIEDPTQISSSSFGIGKKDIITKLTEHVDYLDLAKQQYPELFI